MEIDLIATYQNHQLSLYVSPFPDKQVVATNAFSFNWNKGNTIYLFPPVKALSLVMADL